MAVTIPDYKQLTLNYAKGQIQAGKTRASHVNLSKLQKLGSVGIGTDSSADIFENPKNQKLYAQRWNDGHILKGQEVSLGRAPLFAAQPR
jgi:hypothetical protein